MKKLLFIALSVVLCGSAMAQLKITGRVTDQLGCSLRNAIVQVDGKENLKTTTDKNGEYTITVPKNSTHLVYDYPNMNKTMVEIQGRSKIDVSLNLVSHLQEVFYGTNDNSKILYLVDGKVVSKELFDQIPQTEIKDVNVMKGISSAVVVNTKSGSNVVVGAYSRPQQAMQRQSNGARIDHQTQKTLHETEDEIYMTNVEGPITGETYIWEDGKEVSVKKDVRGTVVSVSSKYDTEKKDQPLCVVKSADGKSFTVKDIKGIVVSDIKHVTVIKSSSKALEEFKKYGDTSNGVIYIELKDKIDETKK
ncbi:MAG: carboxypeptidase-like regulatory domain-containing protein [Alistipes sp.]|nr:carboxypeptidase-like regulatory domain-containing protein [Alistipes sp.]